MDGSKRVFQRLGPSQGDNSNNKQQKVCFHWRAGRCNRFPCPFLHRELPGPPQQQQHSAGNGMSSSKRPHGFSDDNRSAGMRRNPNFNNTWGRTAAGGGAVVRKTEKVCNHWVKGNCTYGNTCRYLHSWTTGDCFTLLTQLEGHQKVIILSNKNVKACSGFVSECSILLFIEGAGQFPLLFGIGLEHCYC